MRSLAVAALLWPATIAANGRAPLTTGVQFRPGDHHALYVATTFGLLVSHDDGCTFGWFCEPNIGYGNAFDPRYRIAADGAIFATTASGLRVSRDGGCSFTTATADQPAGDLGRIAGAWIEAIDIGPTGEVWVATADSGRSNDVYRSTDNGMSFAPRGKRSLAIWWKSVAVAPSRAQRIYVTGYQVAGALADGGQLPPTAHVEVSDDDGATWAASSLAGVRSGPTPIVHVVAVDRGDPDIVFLASRGANPPGGDRLYRSSDGGATWREVLATTGTILDVAVAATASVVVAARGGGFQSANGGATFTPIARPAELACAARRDDGRLYGCAANWAPDQMALATSIDGTTWDKRFRFVELAGPVSCPAGTPQHEICGGQWPALQQQFGATGPAQCHATVPPDPAPASKRSGGCCDAQGVSSGALGQLGVLGAICVAAARRRRR